MSIGRSAQQRVDDTVNHLDFISAVIELSKNPSSVNKMKQDLIDASTLSEDRRKEAEEAEIKISEAVKVLKQLSEAQSAHNEEVKIFETSVAKKNSDLSATEASISARKAEFEKDISTRTKSAEGILAQAEVRHKEADDRDKDYNDKIGKYNSDIADLKARESVFADKVSQHNEIISRFNARKKALAAAAQEASNEE